MGHLCPQNFIRVGVIVWSQQHREVRTVVFRFQTAHYSTNCPARVTLTFCAQNTTAISLYMSRTHLQWMTGECNELSSF